ncbi:hypothetical protein ABPG74_012739 [Tetrahymena malaccensis]
MDTEFQKKLIPKVQSREDILNESYKNSIHAFLYENKVYDCLPKNSQVVVIDKNFSCAEAMNLVIKNDFEEAIIWNQDTSQFDGIITYSDIVNIILKSYKNVALGQIPLSDSQRQTQGFDKLQEEFKKFNEDDQMADDNDVGVYSKNENEMEDEDIKLSNNKSSIPMNQSTKLKGSEQEFHAENYPFNEDQKQIFLSDLQKLSVRGWFRILNQDEYESKELISVTLEAKLQEACSKMIEHKIHRILVIDQESQLVVGILTYKDILLFLIRNLTQDFQGDEKDDQYDIPISYAMDQLCIQEVLSCNHLDTTYNAFDVMMNKWKVSSVPIVGENNAYMGLIHRRDIVFIWKTQNFGILSRPVHEFMVFLKEQKQKYKLMSLEVNEFFEPNDCVRKVVENLFLAQGNRLVSINKQTQQLDKFITLSDIFQYYLQDN